MDGQTAVAALAGSRFGDCLMELPLEGGWGLAAAFSPDGRCLAVASQGSQLTLLSGIDLQDPSSLDATAAQAAGRVQHLVLPCLPLKCLDFLSDTLLAGGGYDGRPVLCSRQGDGTWRYACSLQGGEAGLLGLGLALVALRRCWATGRRAGFVCSRPCPSRGAPACGGAGVKPSSSTSSGGSDGQAVPPRSASLSARIKMFEQQAAAASAAGGGKAAAGAGGAAAAGVQAAGGSGGSSHGKQQQGSGPHENCIMSVVQLPSGTADGCLAFLTASMEGCVAEWWVDPAVL